MQALRCFSSKQADINIYADSIPPETSAASLQNMKPKKSLAAFFCCGQPIKTLNEPRPTASNLHSLKSTKPPETRLAEPCDQLAIANPAYDIYSSQETNPVDHQDSSGWYFPPSHEIGSPMSSDCSLTPVETKNESPMRVHFNSDSLSETSSQFPMPLGPSLSMGSPKTSPYIELNSIPDSSISDALKRVPHHSSI